MTGDHPVGTTVNLATNAAPLIRERPNRVVNLTVERGGGRSSHVGLYCGSVK